MTSPKLRYIAWAVVCVVVIAAVVSVWRYQGQKKQQQTLFQSGDLGIRNSPPNVPADLFEFDPAGLPKRVIFSRYLTQKNPTSTTGSFAYFVPTALVAVHSDFESFFRASPWSLQSDSVGASGNLGWRLVAQDSKTHVIATVDISSSGKGDPTGTIVFVSAVPASK
jgi:hypothetical protein